MARRKHRSAGDLPQQAETWIVAVRQLRIWINPEEETPYRPFVVVVYNAEPDVLQQVELTENQPGAAAVKAILIKAIEKPPKETGQRPHRPRRILVDDEELVSELQSLLAALEIQVGYTSQAVEMDELIVDLETHLRGGRPEIPSLLSVKGVTPQMVGGVFAAAAEFYRAAPWIYLSDQDTLSIRVEPEPEPRFAQVMGNAGIEYGLATYRRWEDVERIFGFADSPMELLAPGGSHSFLFGDIAHLPIDEVEAADQYGWDIAGEDAYPFPVIFTPQEEEVRRPDRKDLYWYEGALRAIPRFAQDHFSKGRPRTEALLESSYTVPTHAGEATVHIKYPAGTISKEGRPAQQGMADWYDEEEEGEEVVTPFDLRSMESFMGTFSTGFEDPQLNKAQDLMYRAWEERNPARRLILAHEALSLSEDCSDAYVLLAEEEADTMGRALEYYQKGVEAGERALGQDYFKENEGYFWGLMETRPYMRAREGLANTLWELGREEEAIGHFRELLRLNPGDNQGIRYALLNLLLEQEKDQEAQTLLEEYDEEGSAEWLYTGALLAFRAATAPKPVEGETVPEPVEGTTQAAEEALQEALGMNPHVPAYLTGRKRIPSQLPAYIGFGDDNEAATYAARYLNLWRRTPGAVDWLQGHLKPPSKRQQTQRPKRRGKRK